MEHQTIVMIVGPSGCGKDTIIQAIRAARPDIHKAVSCTTRPIREGEEAGVAYHFLSVAEFQEKIAQNEFLEWAQFPPKTGDYYGTLRAEVELAPITLLKIEIQGARRIKELYPESLMIFIVPPSIEALRDRIVARGDVPAEKLEGRLSRALAELEEGPALADHVIVNNDGQEGLERAISEILYLLPNQ